jgi:hypothetical protein
MYAHHPSYHLEPRTLGIALSRGLIGHKALEIYYKAILNGKLEAEAVKATEDFLQTRTLREIRIGDGDKAKMITDLIPIIQKYFVESQWVLKRFNILGVENLVYAPLPDEPDIEFAGRIDLMLEEKRGLTKGQVLPWDHKFTYNFWSAKALKMNAQISNYVWAARAMGMHSRGGIINMVRYRTDAIESFRQEEVPTTSVVRKEFIANHTVAARQIVDLKLQDKVGLEQGITRSTSKFNCEYCPFVDLCYTELTGQDVTVMLKANFRPNSYGYDNVLDVE